MFFSLKRLARRRRRIFRCVQVEVTSRCFLRCVMCPLTALADRWVPLDMEERVLEQLVEDADLADMIYLSGWGEP
ncbi:MAG TPA: radical SAM/SPASM domain-containing protein, partial [Candidatus Bathyarchaeota archaeon]|nr:radical SAM/SPASM domain-containing protein [Candidatus Bathyarchaeota archaeon]